ncbi:transposase [Carboxydichorda subterranea]|uniref:transposase n=1 Tax=Carboxydichorda subterranea TaxID=3109565 RepID=UPI0038576C06
MGLIRSRGHLHTLGGAQQGGCPVPPRRPHYPPEFRAEAVRLVRTSGKTQKEIAADLRVSTESLRKWVRQGPAPPRPSPHPPRTRSAPPPAADAGRWPIRNCPPG